MVEENGRLQTIYPKSGVGGVGVSTERGRKWRRSTKGNNMVRVTSASSMFLSARTAGGLSHKERKETVA